MVEPLIRRTQLGALLCAFAVAACAARDPAQLPGTSRDAAATSGSANGPAVIRAMLRAYERTTTFQQFGRAREVITPDDGGEPSRKVRRFHIAFDRPNRMLFDFTEEAEGVFEASRGVVWMHDGAARTWYLDETEETRSLADALRSLSGVSRRTSFVVPSMLLGRGCGWCSDSFIEHAQYLRREAFDGGELDVVFSRSATASETTLWIDATTHFLRRMREAGHNAGVLSERALKIFPPTSRDRLRQPDPFRSEETTEYDPPIVDRPIDASAFDFAPPPRPPK